MYTILLILAVIIPAAVLLNRTPYYRRKEIGAEGEEKTNRILRKFTKNRKCLLMTNVFLPLYDNTCEIDHILFGRFGAVVVETKNISGELCGNGKYLIHKIGKKQHELYNPVLQNETHVKNLRYHLMKAGFKDFPVYSFVVFTSENIKFPSSCGIRINELEHHIKSLPDNKCKFKEAFSATEKIRIRNPIAKIKHNISIR